MFTRGFLSSFTNLTITGQCYDKCTACSDAVLAVFVKNPLALVQKVVADAAWLEVLTGLDVLKQINTADFEWDSDADDSINKDM